jgi:ribonuclease HI
MEGNKKIIAYTDGGSRGNPGPAAYGVALFDERHESIKSFGVCIGTKTNNEAEYAGVVAALKKIKALFGKEKSKKLSVEVRMDSELVCKQLNGIYKVEKEHLWPFFMAIWNLRGDFASIHFVHVPREKNKEADKMVNIALDGGDGATDALW